MEELRKTLAGWGLAALEDPAVLILSELLTNAQRYGRVPGRDIETRFARLTGSTEGGFRVEVHDASPRLPHPREAALDECEGRGLFLVNVLADPTTSGGAGTWSLTACRTPPSELMSHLHVQVRH
ncbi:ATP-binding protein [Streptomyces sp. NPDC054863]